MFFNKIIVIGAGVIGSCYGAMLFQKNIVTLVDNKEVVDRINTIGITIRTKNEKNFALNATTKLEKIVPNTLILLTTKAHQSRQAIKQIKNLEIENSVILILQNGLGNEDIVKKVINDKAEVTRGIVNIGAWQVEPGKFNLILNETILEPTDIGKKITTLFNESGLPARVSKDFVSELWQKLILNCVVNPLTAILRVRNNQIAVPILKRLRHQIVKECLSVSEAEGIFLPANLPEKIDRVIPSYTNFSSMYQDVVNGKETEIDFINGKIIELGIKHNIPTPVNEALYAIIKFMEQKNDIG